jgi:hypothetical protein
LDSDLRMLGALIERNVSTRLQIGAQVGFVNRDFRHRAPDPPDDKDSTSRIYLRYGFANKFEVEGSFQRNHRGRQGDFGYDEDLVSVYFTYTPN